MDGGAPLGVTPLPSGMPQHLPVVIAGAGPIGLACAISARRHGLEPLVIDAGPIVNSIVHYPPGMMFFTTPERLEIGNHPIVCAGAQADPGGGHDVLPRRGPRGGARGPDVHPTGDGRAAEEPHPLRHRGRRGHGRAHLRSPRAGHRLLRPPESPSRARRICRTSAITSTRRTSAGAWMSSWSAARIRRSRRRCSCSGPARVTLVYRGAALKPSVKYWLSPDIREPAPGWGDQRAVRRERGADRARRQSLSPPLTARRSGCRPTACMR